MFHVLHRVAFAVLTETASFAGGDTTPDATPPELGRVQWLRGFDKATEQAKKVDKPVLVLFQEVPGCHTCVSYGQDVLSHPLIVEAAETLFVPVAIFNNIQGPDQITLTSFREKAWNNPVVRIVSADRSALAPRLGSDYSLAGLASTMVTALKELNRPVPEYLSLVATEHGARRAGLERATFVMHCFWEGEAALGKLPATVSTMPGFVNELEVVDVEFDPKVMSYESLLNEAKRLDCASKVFTHSTEQQQLAAKLVGDGAIPFTGTVRPDEAPKYYLANSPYRHVPMTPTQAARVNAALGLKGNPDRFLSLRQQKILQAVQADPQGGWPVVVGAGMIEAWPDTWHRMQGSAAHD